MDIKINSACYKNWEDYLAQHPEIADIPNAKEIQTYEDIIFSFVIDSFG